MHDFDEQRRVRHAEREATLADRSFTLNDQTFSYRANVPFGVIRRVASLTETSDGVVVIDSLVETILDVLEDDNDAHERFRAICEDKDFPLTVVDLIELSNWLITEQTGRPTEAPSPSVPGRTSNGTTSTAGSSSPPDQVSAA